MGKARTAAAVGRRNRQRGAEFEREVRDLFRAIGYPCDRILGQARDGGGDLTPGPWMVECKRRRSLGVVQAAMHQAQASAGKRTPLVVARADGRGEDVLVVLRWADFAALVRNDNGPGAEATEPLPPEEKRDSGDQA